MKSTRTTSARNKNLRLSLYLSVKGTRQMKVHFAERSKQGRAWPWSTREGSRRRGQHREDKHLSIQSFQQLTKSNNYWAKSIRASFWQAGKRNLEDEKFIAVKNFNNGSCTRYDRFGERSVFIFVAIKIWSNLALVIDAYSDEVRRRQGKTSLNNNMN